MKLLFRQRMFSWLDSYDIYDEAGETVYTVQGRLAWGHKLEIYDRRGEYRGMIKEEVMRFLPTFCMYDGSRYIGRIRKEFTFFKPVFTLDCNGWQVNGDYWQWDYQVRDASGREVVRVAKQLFRWTDTYSIEVPDPANGLLALMIVLAIDAAKCAEGR